MNRIRFGLAACLACWLWAVGAAPADGPPPPLTLQDVGGKEHRVFDGPAKAVVFVFLMPDCPIANGYAPEIGRLTRDYSDRGVQWFAVHVDPQLTAEAARKHAEEYKIACPVVLDPKHKLVREAGATRTPEVAVYSPRRELVYRGRIDDRYVDLGQRRPEPTKHDLREALDAMLAGRPVAQPRTEPIGCDIPKE